MAETAAVHQIYPFLWCSWAAAVRKRLHSQQLHSQPFINPERVMWTSPGQEYVGRSDRCPCLSWPIKHPLRCPFPDFWQTIRAQGHHSIHMLKTVKAPSAQISEWLCGPHYHHHHLLPLTLNSIWMISKILWGETIQISGFICGHITLSNQVSAPLSIILLFSNGYSEL